MAETIWDEEKLRQGFNRFYNENGYFPTADEIDKADYLPSSRQIQRRFGGLVSLREKMGLAVTDNTKGSTRSKKTTEINNRGLEQEIELEGYLVSEFGEEFVHTEKRLPHFGKSRVDFFIYAKGEKIAVDVFYPESIKLLQRIINIKHGKYGEYRGTFCYVCCNPNISYPEINKAMSNKAIQIPHNFHILTIDSFKEFMHQFSKNTIQK